ncbi:hypothetical protein J6590_071446 [Homalodisca vitripennis]|nr:hypothetical protein J6590_071446 [Homalodisca vitripennis]
MTWPWLQLKKVSNDNVSVAEISRPTSSALWLQSSLFTWYNKKHWQLQCLRSDFVGQLEKVNVPPPHPVMASLGLRTVPVFKF